MRRIILVLSVLLSLPAFSQSIGFRKDTDESLKIGTNYMLQGHQLGVALVNEVNKQSKEETWQIDLIVYGSTAFKIDRGARLLIKTFSGTVVVTEQLIDCYNIKSEIEYPATGVTRYSVYPIYQISNEDLQVIMKEGIQKLRFETTRGIYDATCDKDYYGEIVRKEYNLIKGKSDFEAGF